MPTKITSDLAGVAALFDSRRQVGGGSYCLCAYDKKIILTEGRIPHPGRVAITVLLAADINEGPTPKLWEVIDARIRKLKEEGIL